MKAESIIMQLQYALPNLCSYFTDDLNITALTRSGSTVTAISSTPHNLQTGDVVRIAGAIAPTLITSLTQTNGIATAITDTDHDLTEGFFPKVQVIGATQAEYNGTFDLTRVQNRLTFSYALDSAPISPATGSEILLLTAGLGTYNGLFQVTIINPTTFTYQITTTPYPQAHGNIVARKAIRISGAATIDRALESYTAQSTNKLWAYVVLDETVASKDRYTINDAVASRSIGVDYRIRLLKNFSIYLIVPATQSIAGRYERDLIEDLEPIIYKSILGIKFQSPFTENAWSLITPISHGLYAYTKAYYVHRFQFQTTYDILEEDTGLNPDSRAFRDLYLNYDAIDTEGAQVTIAEAYVNLDDIPLT